MLEKEIIFNENQESQVQTGYLLIKSSEPLNIDSIVGSIYFEARGRMSSQKTQITTTILCNNKKLIKNESYKIPFSFDLGSANHYSYNGKNVSFSFNCEIKIHVNEDDLNKLDISFYSKIKSFITSDKSIKTTAYFEFKNSQNNYQVIKSDTIFKLQFNLIISLLTALIIGSFYAFYIPDYNPLYIFLGILLIGFSIYLVKKYIGNVLGDITMNTLRNNDTFFCIINKNRNFNLRKQYVYYVIKEKVIDQRGTSSTTYTETVYESEKIEISNFKTNPKLKFNYPKNNNLQTTSFNDVSIIWEMNIKGTTYFGIVLKYKCEFTVTNYVDSD